MSDNKVTIDDIEVPEGMWNAVMSASAPYVDEIDILLDGLKAALLYLAEHPIVPTQKFLIEMLEQDRFGGINWSDDQVFIFCTEWQLRMFLKRASEVPEELKEILCDESIADTHTGRRSTYNAQMIKAYELGKKAANDKRGA